MTITTQMIIELREKTGVGMVDCKKALEETDGDIEQAILYLRKTGQKKLEKKQDRATGEGVVEAYVHAGGRVGVLVLLRSETDFVSRNESFRQLAHDISMHVAATNPKYLSPDEISEEELKKEHEVYRAQLHVEGKSEDMIEKIVQGKIIKYYQEVCLLKQAFIKDDKKTIEELIAEAVNKLGENIRVEKFVRFSL